MDGVPVELLDAAEMQHPADVLAYRWRERRTPKQQREARLRQQASGPECCTKPIWSI